MRRPELAPEGNQPRIDASRPSSHAAPPQDARCYSKVREESDRHIYYQCCEFQMIDGERRGCKNRARSDHHNQLIKQGKPHQCKFTTRIIALPDVLPQNSPYSAIWDRVAHFVGCHNIPIQTIVSSDFRDILEFAFREGYYESSLHRNGWVDAAFSKFCQVQKRAAIRKRIIRVAEQDRLLHEQLLSQSRFAGLTMDGGQIEHVKLFVTNLLRAIFQSVSLTIS
jgi:hypothetical protein